MKKIVIIDGKSVYYRGYYAMGHLSRHDGRPTGGVYGFAVISLELVKRLNPDKVVVAWDSPTSTAKRKRIYSEYKAGRQKPPEDFYAQIPDLKKLVSALSWELVECEEYEADDIIGTLCSQVQRSDSQDNQADQWEAVIISSDLDMLQVVDKNVKMYRLLRGFSELIEMDIPAIEAKYGIKKQQFLDLKALKGDTSDNIPGVAGIGEKGAVKLLSEYGTLAGIYQHINEISGATQKKLIAGQKSAEMSYRLAEIMTDAPVKLVNLPWFKPNWGEVIAILQDLEFASLVRKYEDWLKSLSSASNLAELKTKTATAPNPFKPATKEVVMTDITNAETRPNVPDLPPDLIVSWDIKQLMHKNSQIAEQILAGAEFWDLGQGAFLLDPLQRHTGTETKDKAIDNKISDLQPAISQTDLLTSVQPYNITDEEKREYWHQRTEMAKLPKVQEIFQHYDLPMIPVLYKMEKRGILVDLAYFKKLSAELSNESYRREQEIIRLAGATFNVNSPMQLSEILFEKLQLPSQGIKKTARGYSTGAKELEKLRSLHPIVEKILEYREVAKLLNTYVLPIPKLVDAEGRIHTTFTQNVTSTGRLSSVNPNLQNIPVRTEAGQKIRRGYIAGKGKKFVSADYSQFELRLAGVLAQDESLIADFNQGVDIHTKTAADVFGIPMAEVTKAQRRIAKVINFSVLYGMSAKGLADATGMKIDEAKQFIEDYFTVRKPIRLYLDKILEQARTKGYVETCYGRRRPTPDINSPNFVVRSSAERAAQNMPIQGTEADLMKRSMIAIEKKLSANLGDNQARMILQVHDSVMAECNADVAEEVAETLKDTMENIAPELPIRLAVEVKISDWWI